jgi:uncharacterized protein (DUF433 family)
LTIHSGTHESSGIDFRFGDILDTVICRGWGTTSPGDPDILGGTPAFEGTRVPFRNLIDYLERGYSVEEFLDAFPSVTREQVVASLEAAHEALSGRARSVR